MLHAGGRPDPRSYRSRPAGIKGAGRELVQRIRNDVATVLQQPDIRQRMLEIGGEPVGNTPEEFEARVGKEIAMWRQVAAVARIKPE
jgi:tripartite-type tricarboxylate transporter receptor subunit TctC